MANPDGSGHANDEHGNSMNWTFDGTYTWNYSNGDIETKRADFSRTYYTAANGHSRSYDGTGKLISSNPPITDPTDPAMPDPYNYVPH